MPSHVFICYARDDQDFVLTLAKKLKDRGVPVWVDQWDIPKGANWNRTIDQAIYQCAQFLIVLSQAAVDSVEVGGEWITALEEKKPVLPVIREECRIPRQLRLFRHIVFTSRQPDDSSVVEEILGALGITDSVETGVSEAPPRSALKRVTRRQPKPVKPKPTEGKKSFTNTIGMTFVHIPSGTFMMGTSLTPKQVTQKYGGETQWYEDEYPQHKVTVSRSFYLKSTAVTQGQWKKVMGGNPSHFEECGDDYPVENVSWYDAQDFIKKLNEMENTGKYRLPTEAEWEYACRAGSTTAFSFGDEVSRLGEYGWYWDNSEKQTHPVGQKKPNVWGLYDMHGNVLEWCQDWYGDYPSGEVSDPEGPPTGDYRVLRGGS